jgi:hypothetical protein
MIPSGIEPAIFRIEAQRLINCATVAGGCPSNPQASAAGYILVNLVAVPEILKLQVSVQ